MRLVPFIMYLADFLKGYIHMIYCLLASSLHVCIWYTSHPFNYNVGPITYVDKQLKNTHFVITVSVYCWIFYFFFIKISNLAHPMHIWFIYFNILMDKEWLDFYNKVFNIFNCTWQGYTTLVYFSNVCWNSLCYKRDCGFYMCVCVY